ncbi:hypothetical protein [uncultured Flavobacterium sp.]|uniref:hypothetical protein n=1 Tax=uncultured Flavobacterium sp. TaxID=165435 RepID=UPI0025D223FF|nr:hypothetical protein [uncultured Flavobacterium sp.]
MGLFKKKKGAKDFGAERLFKEAVKEMNELYDDIKSDYSDTGSIVSDFTLLLEGMKDRMDASDAKKLEEFSARLKKMDSTAKNTVRDIRDVLRSQKKRLAEIKRERD